jgi:hypothetical protein
MTRNTFTFNAKFNESVMEIVFCGTPQCKNSSVGITIPERWHFLSVTIQR